MRPLKRVDAFLFAAERRDRLLVTHLALAVLLGLRVGLGPYSGLAGQPAALFRPVWFLRALPAMPPAVVIVAVQVVGVAGAALAVSARRRRWGFAVAWACLLVLAGLRDSQGKILHNDVLLLLVCVPFLAAPAVGRDDDPEASPRYGWPVRTALVVVAGAYFFCGFHKLRISGLAWVTTDNLRFVFLAAGRGGRATFPGVARLLARSAPLDHVLAAGVLAFELSFPVVLFSARVRPAYATGAVALHTGIWLALGLDYWAWIGVVAAVLVDWTQVVTAAGTPRPPGRASPAAARAGGPARPGWPGTPAGPGTA